MATAIGDLVVRLGMDSKAFNRGMSATKDALKGFGMVATATAAAGAGVAAMALRQAQAMDAIGDRASQLGIATEALVSLQHQAELAGTSADVLDGAMAKMAKNIGEAVLLGTGDAQNALEALKLDPKDLVGKAPEAQFGAIADAMQGIQSQAEKTAVATKIFGRSGAELIPMLAGGSQAMKEAARDAEYLGIAFDAVDAAKAGAVADEWYRVKQSITGLKNAITVALAPALTAAATGLTTFFAELRKSGPALSGVFTDGAKAVTVFGNALNLVLRKMLEIQAWQAAADRNKATNAGAPQSEINRLSKTYGDLLRRIRELEGQDWGAQLRESYQRVAQAVAAAGAAAEVAKGPIQAALEAPQTATSKAIDLVAEWRKQIEGFGLSDRQKAIADLGGNLELGMGGTLGRLDEQLTELERHAEMLKIAERLREQFSDPFDVFAEKVQTYRDMLQQGMIDQKVYDAAVSDARKAFEVKPETFEQQGPRYAAAAERGSREAYSVLMNSRRDDGTKKLVNINTKQLEVLNRIDRNLQVEQRITIPTA